MRPTATLAEQAAVRELAVVVDGPIDCAVVCVTRAGGDVSRILADYTLGHDRRRHSGGCQLSVSRAAAWRTAIIINQTSTVAGLGLATRCRDVAACRATGTSPV